MNNFIITTDTTSDLPAAYVEQHQIGMLLHIRLTILLILGSIRFR